MRPREDQVAKIGRAAYAAILATGDVYEEATQEERLLGLCAAVTLAVSYESAQTFLDQLASSFDAKEHARLSVEPQ